MINVEILRKIKDKYYGTCVSLSYIIDSEELDIDENELEDRLLDVNLEKCKLCDWWYDSGELLDDENEDSEPGFCSDCR